MSDPVFLTDGDVLQTHARMIRDFGGEPGLRDPGLLSSAVAQPSVSFGGEFLQGDLFGMAAALHYSLVKNHAFIDGNKRTAMASMLAFLRMNGVRLPENATDALVDLTMAVATDEIEKDGVAGTLRTLAAGTLAKEE